MCFLYHWIEPKRERRTSAELEIEIKQTFSEISSMMGAIKKAIQQRKHFSGWGNTGIIVNQRASSEKRDVHASIDLNVVYPYKKSKAKTSRNQNI